MIICEAGQNHLGSTELAMQMIDLAEEAGATLVKFQLYDHKKLYGKTMKDVSLTYAQAETLFSYGTDKRIEVFFSVFDVERVKWCEKIGVKRYKVACEFRDPETLLAITQTQKPIIVSGNGFYIEDRTYKLYCLPKYPHRVMDVNVYDMDECDGYSDHSIGLDACKVAISRGANIIEKHFCLDHQTGVDAAWSADFEELKELVRFDKVCKGVL